MMPACSNDIDVAEGPNGATDVPEKVEVALNLVDEVVSTSENYLTRAANDGKTLYAINVYSKAKDAKDSDPWNKYAFGLFDNPSAMKITLVSSDKYKFECTKVVEDFNKLYFETKDDGTPFYGLPFNNVNFTTIDPNQNYDKETQLKIQLAGSTRILNKFERSNDINLAGVSSATTAVLPEADKNYYKHEEIKTTIGMQKYTDPHIPNATLETHPKYWSQTTTPGTDRWYGELKDYVPTVNGKVNITLRRTAFGLNVQIVAPSDGRVEITCGDAFKTTFTPQIKVEDQIKTIKSMFALAPEACLKEINAYEEKIAKGEEAEEYKKDLSLTVRWVRGNRDTKEFSTSLTVHPNKMLNVYIDVNKLDDSSLNFNENDVLGEESKPVIIGGSSENIVF